MNANDVGSWPIRAGAEQEIVPQIVEIAVPINPEANRGKPPQKVKKMRSGQFRYAMPSALREIHVLNTLAVDIHLETVRQVGQPFGHDSLAAVALVKERGNKRNSEPSRPGLLILRALVPSRQNWNPRRIDLLGGTRPGGCTLTNRSGNRKRIPSSNHKYAFEIKFW
jgi:hypothetical protein